MRQGMKRKPIPIDVSGDSDPVDERGRFVNNDIPEEARRGTGSSSSKKSSRKSLKSKEDREKDRQRRREEEEEESKPKKKRKQKSSKKESSKKEVGKKRKNRRKTVGELLDKGHVEKAQRKTDRANSRAVKVVDKTNIESDFLPDVISSPTTETDFQSEYNHIYGKLGELIRKLEERMGDNDKDISSRDVYALMTMYSQMRETMADMRSIQDVNEQSEALAQDIFDPAMKTSGESMVRLYYKIMTLVRHNVQDPKVVEVLTEGIKKEVSDQAGRLQEQLQDLRNKIPQSLNGK